MGSVVGIDDDNDDDGDVTAARAAGFPRSRSPDGLGNESARDLFGPDRRQTLATISETLGAINTVGRYLVNYTRGGSGNGTPSSSPTSTSIGSGGLGLGLNLGSLLGTPTVLSDRIEET